MFDPDMVILSLAMKMHCQPRKDYELARTEMYALVKRGCSDAEQNNVLSVKLLQAYLLVALYEIGNALYPAAYLTIGHCARLGYAMGIHNRQNAPQMFSQPGKLYRLQSIDENLWGPQCRGQKPKRDVGCGGRLLF
jgi:hypothetical protein